MSFSIALYHIALRQGLSLDWKLTTLARLAGICLVQTPRLGQQAHAAGMPRFLGLYWLFEPKSSHLQPKYFYYCPKPQRYFYKK